MSPGKGLVLDVNILIRAVLGKGVRTILEKYVDSANSTHRTCVLKKHESTYLQNWKAGVSNGIPAWRFLGKSSCWFSL
jgi:hypothetical protein